jgi:Zn-dependent protease with chaperone function
MTSPFTPEDAERARRYHRPLYAAFAADAAIGLAALAALAFGPPGEWLHRPVRALPWWAETIAFTGLILIALDLLRLPLSYWRGLVHERRWGFSTQSFRGWLADRAKGAAVGVVLTGGLILGFVAVARWLPGSWPLVAAPAGGAVVVFLSFVAPVVLEPLFNRFTPMADRELAGALCDLSRRAGVPVRDVLVADASRRTRKENAYVSGLGRTRRVVLFDTLLARADPRQITLVTAHELGHRRARHVAQGTALAVAGMVGAVAVLWALLRDHAVLSAIGAAGPGNPPAIPFVLFVGALLEVAALPFASAISRRWETWADRFSLELTGDLGAFEASHVDLARSNLIDLDPPRLLYLATFTHPTPPERIANARTWAGELGLTSRAPSRATTA